MDTGPLTGIDDVTKHILCVNFEIGGIFMVKDTTNSEILILPILLTMTGFQEKTLLGS